MRSRIGPGLDVRPTPPRGIWDLREIAKRKLGGAWPQALPPAWSELTYPQAVLDDAAFAYWRLDDTDSTVANDSVSTLGGTYSGSPVSIDGPIDGHTVKLFDGVNDFVDITSIAGKMTSRATFTMECWVRPDSDGATGEAIIAAGTSTGDNRFHLALLAGQGFRLYAASAAGNVLSWTGYTIGQWYHLAVVRSGTSATMYVNGVAVSTGTWSDVFASSDKWFIGQEEDPGNVASQWFPGGIGEVAFYGYNLTAEQVRDHYYRGLGFRGHSLSVLADGPLALWSLDEESGATALNSQGDTGRNGSYIGSPVFGQDGYVEAGNGSIQVGPDDGFDALSTVYVTATIEMWVKPDPIASGYRYIWAVASPANNVAINHTYLHPDGSVTWEYYSGGWRNAAPMPAGSVQFGEWNHLVWTWRNGLQQAWVNGVLVSTTSFGTVADGGGTLYRFFLHPYLTSGVGFTGLVDEVSFYDVEIAPNQITEHYARGVTSPAEFHYHILKDGPSAYWRLGEEPGAATAEDEIRSINGTYNGPTLGVPRLTPGGSGSAVEFDGVDDYVSMGDISILDGSPAWAIEAWFRLDSTIGQRAIVSKWVPTSEGAGNYRAFLIDYYEGSVRALFGSSNSQVLLSAPGIQKGIHHVVMVADGSTARLYIDGEEKASAAYGVAFQANNAAFAIGAKFDGTVPSAFLHGAVDEVAVYGKSLSALQVRDHYLRGKGLATSEYFDAVVADEPIQYYRMDQGIGSFLLDKVRGESAPLIGSGFGAVGPLRGDNIRAFDFVPNSRADVPIAGSYLQGSYTIEFWAKWDSDSGVAIGHGTGGGTRANLHISRNADGAAANPGRIRFGWYADDLDGVTVVTVGEWHHVVCTYDLDTNVRRIYLDGVLESENSPAGGYVSTHPMLYLGAWYVSTFYYFDGKLDEVALYDKALTADQVRTHYNAAFGPAVAAVDPPSLPASVPAPELRLSAASLSAPDGGLVETWLPVVDELGVTTVWQANSPYRPRLIAADGALNNRPTLKFVKPISNIIYQNFRAAAAWAGEIWYVGYLARATSGEGPYFINLNTNGNTQYKLLIYPYQDGTLNWGINNSWQNKTASIVPATGAMAAGASRDASLTSVYFGSTTARLSSSTQPSAVESLTFPSMGGGVELRLAEVIAFPVALTSAQRADLYAYFQSEYGVA